LPLLIGDLCISKIASLSRIFLAALIIKIVYDKLTLYGREMGLGDVSPI